MEYGIEETLAPKRTVTAVVKTASETLPFAPVRTDKPIAKQEIPSLLKAIREVKAGKTFRMKEALIKDFNNTGVNVVFSRTLK